MGEGRRATSKRSFFLGVEDERGEWRDDLALTTAAAAAGRGKRSKTKITVVGGGSSGGGSSGGGGGGESRQAATGTLRLVTAAYSQPVNHVLCELSRGCAVLCCAVLCSAVLCCAVLCCAVLCCAVLCCAVLCCERRKRKGKREGKGEMTAPRSIVDWGK